MSEESEKKAKWYVVHTYSGYENKVKANIDKAVENHNLQELIYEVKVPMEEQIEEKNGKRRSVKRKVFPGYVVVKMVMTDESWYVVRNTRGVTGFVGPGSKPIPLTDKEIRMMGVEDSTIELDIKPGDNVRVVSGPLENFIGVIEEIDTEKRKIRVSVSMFGRETPIDLDFNQVQSI